MIQVDKNIPIPELIGRCQYPFQVMDIGDSFLLPEKINVSAASTLVSIARKKNNEKDWVKAKDGNCIRVWRIK